MTHEQKAFLSNLVETATPKLTPYLLRTHSIEQVEEILQETYLAACVEIETLIRHEKPEAWLFTAAAHRARRLETQLQTERIRYEELPDDPVDTKILWPDTIDEILPEDTPPRDRTVLKMYYEQKLDTDEIAEDLGITRNNAKQVLKRSRDRLKKTLAANFKIFLILM